MQNKAEKISNLFSMIDRWKASGKSIKAFCKEENISYHLFSYWKKQYSKQNNPKGFIKIKPVDHLIAKDSTCAIILTNGHRITFSNRPEVGYLKELLS